MTPCELWVEFEAHRLIASDAFERDTMQAWQDNRIYFETMRDKRMPDPKQLLGGESRRKRTRGVPTLEEQKASLMEISKKYGIPMRTVVH